MFSRKLKGVDNVGIFDSNNHSAFILRYHLIICTKHRHKVIGYAIAKRLKEIFLYIIPTYNIKMENWNYNNEHIHASIKCRPNTEMSKFINAYKSASSRLIKKEFPQIIEQLSEKTFWSSSYCLLTHGNVTPDIIYQYIQTQGGDYYKNKFVNKI